MMIELRCGAPHKDPRRPTDTCNAVAVVLPPEFGEIVFKGVVKRRPVEPDGKIYTVCPSCGSVNKFVVLSPAKTETIAELQSST